MILVVTLPTAWSPLCRPAALTSVQSPSTWLVVDIGIETEAPLRMTVTLGAPPWRWMLLVGTNHSSVAAGFVPAMVATAVLPPA